MDGGCGQFCVNVGFMDSVDYIIGIILRSMNQSRKLIEDYVIQLQPMIGKGNFADVYLCQQKSTNNLYAMKVIKKSTIINNPYYIKAFQLEIETQKAVSHPNIVKFIASFQTTDNYYIVQEYCPNGNLRQVLTQNGRVSESDAIKCAEYISMAFSQLLKKGIIHRDLKPQNLLLNGELLKLADFGLAKRVQTHQQLNVSIAGTPIYMSPQILQKQKYSSKCDVWSLGTILYELIYGKTPFIATTQAQLINNITTKPLTFPSQPPIMDKTKSFIKSTLKVNESERVSWIEIFEHQLFDGRLMEIANEWKERYVRANKILRSLSKNLELQFLLGIFFRFNSPYLDLEQFLVVIKTIIPNVDEADLGIMYQLFDKNADGYIFMEQFISKFKQYDKLIVNLVRDIIEKGVPFDQMHNYDYYHQIASSFNKYSSTIIEEVYQLISNIHLA